MKHLSRNLIILVASVLTAAGPVVAAPAKAPPLPPGSQKVKLQMGQNPSETVRAKHAHQRPKKDKKIDDTRTGPALLNATATVAK